MSAQSICCCISGAGVDSVSGAAGASHAGRGGRGRRTATYVIQPVEGYDGIYEFGQPGSGGGSYSDSQRGGNGGGVIQIATSQLVVDGTISLDGSDGAVHKHSFMTSYLNFVSQHANTCHRFTDVLWWRFGWILVGGSGRLHG